jgi:hypothetical protein
MRFADGRREGDLRYWCYLAASDGPGPGRRASCNREGRRRATNESTILLDLGRPCRFFGGPALSSTIEWPFLFYPPTSPLVGLTSTGVLSSRRGASRAQFSFSGGVVHSEYSTCLFFSLHFSSDQVSWFPTLGSAAEWFD